MIIINHKYLFSNNRLKPMELYVHAWACINSNTDGHAYVNIHDLYDVSDWFDLRYDYNKFYKMVRSAVDGLCKKGIFTINDDCNETLYVVINHEYKHYKKFEDEIFYTSKNQYEFFIMMYIEYSNSINEYYGKLEQGCAVSISMLADMLELKEGNVEYITRKMSDSGKLFIKKGNKTQTRKYWTKFTITNKIRWGCNTIYESTPDKEPYIVHDEIKEYLVWHGIYDIDNIRYRLCYSEPEEHDIVWWLNFGNCLCSDRVRGIVEDRYMYMVMK